MGFGASQTFPVQGGFLSRRASAAGRLRRRASSEVVQTAILGGALALAAGGTMARSPYLPHPLLSGAGCAAFIAALTAVGCIAMHRGVERRTWLVPTALGLCGAATLDATSVPVLDLVGALARATLPALAVYALLSFPRGRLCDRASRLVLLVTAAASAVVWTALLVAADRLPELVPTARCADRCPPNALGALRGGARFTDALAFASWALPAAALAATAAVLAHRLLHAGTITRRTTAPVLVSVTTLALTLTAATALRGAAASEPALSRLGWMSSLAVLSVPAALLLGMLGARIYAGTALERLVARLGRDADATTLRRALADALGDASLTIAYWRPKRRQYVDAGGRPVALETAAPGRSVTVVSRDGRTQAVILHDPALDAEPGLVASAGGAALMMLENARLEADLRASLAELRASRARLATAADAGRRAIERDLHDGAQQRLVALRLKLAEAEARATSDRDLQQSLSELGADAEATLDELRDLAHGVYPAVLGDHGLAVALRSAARAAALPVHVDAAAVGRLEPELEATVYFCCLEAIQNAVKHAGPGASVTVTVTTRPGHVAFAVSDDGVGFDVARGEPGHGLANLADRVAAAGGELRVSSHPSRGTTVRGDLPSAGRTQAARLVPAVG
ncbi:MAG: ATP-binding protein [Solirubrobacteraceae bacterium]